jgi:hypothetical protein
MFPLIVFGQNIYWEQIRPISAQVEKSVLTDNDLVLIQDVSGIGGIEKKYITYRNFLDGIMPFEYIDFDTTVTDPARQTGRIWWNNIKNTFSFYDNINNTVNDINQELTFSVYNGNAFTIPNGTVVTPDVNTIITYGDNRYRDKSHVLAVATHDIEPYTWGKATKAGQVGGLNTFAYVAGQELFLGEDGLLIPDEPTGGSFIAGIAIVDSVSLTDGIITVDIHVADRTAEQNDETGWPETVGSVIAFHDVTRQLTVYPLSGSTFYRYEDGMKYISTGDSIILPDENGQYLIYYDEDVLTYIKNPSLFQAEPIIRRKCLVSWVNYDADNNEAIFVEDERHKRANYYSRLLHVLFHFSPNLGTQYLYGLELQDLDVDGTGNSNTNAQFGVEAGGISDEDLFKLIPTASVPETYPVFYRSGPAGDWKVDYQTFFAQLNAPLGRMLYNEWTGVTWQNTEMTNGYYAPILVYATGGVNNKLAVVMSQNEYSSESDALIAALKGEGSLNDVGQFPFTESRLIGVILAHTRSNFSNLVQTRFISLTIGGLSVDYYDTRLTGGGSGGEGGTGGAVIAADVAYSNTISGLLATNVQDAIDELDALIDINITNIATNAADILINSGNIATNTSDIADHELRITDNESDILTLQGQAHDPVTLAGAYDYLTLSGQEITLNQIDYDTDISNLPSIGGGGASLLDTIILASHGFAEGDVIDYNAKAIGNNADNSNVIGIVYEVIDASTFSYQYAGVYDKGTWTVGMDYFLSTSVAGAAEDNTQTYDLGDVYLFLGTGVDNGLLLEIDVGYLIQEADTVTPTPGIAYYYEDELTDSETVIDVGFALSTTSLVFVNGAALSTNEWSYSGTSITLNMPVLQYDLLIVKTGEPSTEGYDEFEVAGTETQFTSSFTLTSTTLLTHNGAAVSQDKWTGEGTTTLDVTFPTAQYDRIIIKN